MSQRETIKLLAKHLTRELAEKGFSFQSWTRLSDIARCYWCRTGSWYEHRIELWYHSGLPDLVNLGVGVYIPCRSDEMVMLDARSLDFVIGKERRYSVPSVLVGLRQGAFFTRVTQDVLQALPWFEEFSDPKTALAMLNGGQTNNGIADTRPVRDLRAFLEALPTQL